MTLNVMKGLTENLNNEESLILAADKQVIMKTAPAEAMDPDISISEARSIMMDTSSQRTYATEEITKKLQLRNEDTKPISIFTFAANKPKETVTPHVSFILKPREGNILLIKVNIVP